VTLAEAKADAVSRHLDTGDPQVVCWLKRTGVVPAECYWTQPALRELSPVSIQVTHYTETGGVHLEEPILCSIDGQTELAL
jgi:hypothetical protein